MNKCMSEKNYTHLAANNFDWGINELGSETSVFRNVPGLIVSLIRGKKGEEVKEHSHTHGSLLHVLTGRLKIDSKTIEAGDMGFCHNGGQYGIVFLEDSVFLSCRVDKDKISVKD